MEKDFGIRFTDELYATRDDVKKALNISSIDSIWDKITQFRAYYTRQIGLKNIERVPFNIVLPPKLTSRIVRIEKRMTRLLIKYKMGNVQNPEAFRRMEKNAYLTILRTISDCYEIHVGDETLEAIVEKSLPTLPVEYLILDRYYRALIGIQSRHRGNFSESVVLSLYARLRGIEFDMDRPEDYYRTSDLIDRADHVFVGQHYEACPLEKIRESVVALCDFLNQSSLFSVCKAAVAYFYIRYIKPFEYYNDEMAILMFKYVLAKEDFEEIPSLLLLEDWLSREKEPEIEYLSRESEMKLDLTYIVNYLSEHLSARLDDFNSGFEEVDSRLVIEENYPAPEPKTVREAETPLPDLHENGPKEIEGVTFAQKVSLPTLPTGLDEKDASLVAANLLEIFPSMKRGQAQFYSRHCTIGKYYTISQYKQEQKVAYETARTSMDNLVNLGFYKKEQLKNKFVYTPVIKND